jgi:hypothetical protein
MGHASHEPWIYHDEDAWTAAWELDEEARQDELALAQAWAARVEYCELCDAPGQVTDWHGVNLCATCLAVAEEREAADLCTCVDCLCHQQQHV